MVLRPRQTLKIQLFGGFRAQLDDKLLTSLKLRAGEQLLSLLILNGGLPVENTYFANKLWPTTGSLDNLRQSVSYLRKELGTEGARICAAKCTLHIDIKDASIDVIIFDSLVHQSSKSSLEEAISLYRGTLLDGWTQEWVFEEAAKRHQKYLDALKNLCKLYMQEREHQKSLKVLRILAENLPADKYIWYKLMQILIQNEEYTEAIDIYRIFKGFLKSSYNTLPPDSMKELYDSIYQPSLNSSNLPIEDSSLPENVGGALVPDSKYYIQRQIDLVVQSLISRGDSIVLLKGPRHTGKSSLLARNLVGIRNLNFKYVICNLSKFTSNQLINLDKFYMSVIQCIVDQLDLRTLPNDGWNTLRGPNDNLERFIKNEVLAKSDAGIALVFDDIDLLFTHPYSTEFFSLIRSWHNDRALEPTGDFRKLTMVISYCSEAFLFITDLNLSPFNIGTKVKVTDFSLAELTELNDRYDCPLLESQLKDFHEYLGGIPLLVNKAMYELKSNNFSTNDIIKVNEVAFKLFEDHLNRIQYIIKNDEELMRSIKLLISNKKIKSLNNYYRLKNAGIIVGDNIDNAKFRCLMYYNYFLKNI